MSAFQTNRPPSASADGQLDHDLGPVREALRGLRFGSVNIIIQDGVVVQIDRIEKRRVRRSKSKGRESGHESL